MGGFFRKVERFVLNLAIIILVILISVQFLLNNETAYQRIQEVEQGIRNFFSRGEPEVVPVLIPVEEKTGYITLDLLQDLSLPQVWLNRNGEKVANFAEGIVIAAVREGDRLSLDASQYGGALWFEITSLSPVISTWPIGAQFRVRKQLVTLGEVRFYEQL